MSQKTMREQADAWLGGRYLELSSRHAAKVALGIKGNGSTGKIHSIRTFNTYVGALGNAGEWCRAQYGVRRLKRITSEMGQAYLTHRVSCGIGQKQLDADRMALWFVVGKLETVKTTVVREKTSRRYTREQMEQIAKVQDPKYALATKLAFWSGIRAHELLTIQRGSGASPHREWSADRFKGREGCEVYTVIGKGDLRREVVVPPKIAAQLEALRHDSPRRVVDRGVNYTQHYALGGGQAWSQQFSTASTAVLGWSRGGHGLRHTYVQMRLNELQDYFGYDEARHILTQELGHFRRDVTNDYLR